MYNKKMRVGIVGYPYFHEHESMMNCEDLIDGIIAEIDEKYQITIVTVGDNEDGVSKAATTVAFDRMYEHKTIPQQSTQNEATERFFKSIDMLVCIGNTEEPSPINLETLLSLCGHLSRSEYTSIPIRLFTMNDNGEFYERH